MVWAAGCVAARRKGQREVEVVVRGAGHKAGKGNQGHDDSADCTLLGTCGEAARVGAGIHVGNSARK